MNFNKMRGSIRFLADASFFACPTYKFDIEKELIILKQRMLLSLLSILALVYLALPILPMNKGNAAILFTFVWLGFCVIAFGGNLSGILFRIKRTNRSRQDDPKPSTNQMRKKRMGI